MKKMELTLLIQKAANGIEVKITHNNQAPQSDKCLLGVLWG